MKPRSQLIIAVSVISITLLLAKIFSSNIVSDFNSEAKVASATVDTGTTQTIAQEETKKDVRKIPVRKMDVLDPQVDAESILVESLNSDFPLFNYNTEKQWPIASLTKLMTAIVITEEYGLNKKIPISKTAVSVEGIAGELKSGESYSSEDLMKIMLMVSSNRAATAFEEYAGGRDLFSAMQNKKALELEMTHTTFFDGSGLSEKNISTTGDLLKLAKYLIEKHPEIIDWTRLQTIRVQPVNTSVSRDVRNINDFAAQTRFLGGKTGTSPEARENLLALFSFNNDRIIYIILGTHNRITQTDKILDWINQAYIFN